MAARKRLAATPSQATHTVAVEARVEHIADLMRGLEFTSGKTVRQLAQTWGLSEQRVRELSAEASRRVRAELTKPKAARRDVLAALRQVVVEGLREGDRKAVVSACALIAKVLGFDGATRVELTGKGGVPVAIKMDVTRMTDEELERLARGEPPGSSGAG